MAMTARKSKTRGKFNDVTRAQIFAWDRAVCALTGANLWMLDYGLSGMEQEDWADHIKPAAKGGRHVRENGVCTSASANFTKSANGRANEYWFIGGRPTYRFYVDLGKVPEETATWLKRNVEPRDWYFNRSVRNLMLAVYADGCDVVGYKRHEDRLYYPRAALRFLNEFRKAWRDAHDGAMGPTQQEAVDDWQERRLLPRPVWPEQAEILKLLDCETADQIAELVPHLSKRYARNLTWVERMDAWTKTCDAAKGQSLIDRMRKDAGVSPLVEDLVTHNVRVLSGLPKPPREEAKRGTTRRLEEYE